MSNAHKQITVCRLSVPVDSSITTTEVLKALKNHHNEIIGAQGCYAGKAIDVVARTEAGAAEIAASGFDHDERHYSLVLVDPRKKRIHVSVFIPIPVPDVELRNLLARYGKIHRIRRLHFKEADLRQFENGVRVVEFDELTTPLPSRLSFNGLNIGFKYTDQPRTCARCSSLEHLVRECPMVRARARPTKPVLRPQTATAETPSPPTASETTQERMDDHEADSSAPSAHQAPEAEELASQAEELATKAKELAHGAEKTTTEEQPRAEPEQQDGDLLVSGSKRGRSTVPPSPVKGSKLQKKETYDLFADALIHSGRPGCDIFVQIPLKTLNKARSLRMQQEHGPFTADLAASVGLRAEESVSKQWRKLREQDQATCEQALRALYKESFEGKLFKP